jgi:hypothetical protein
MGKKKRDNRTNNDLQKKNYRENTRIDTRSV